MIRFIQRANKRDGFSASPTAKHDLATSLFAVFFTLAAMAVPMCVARGTDVVFPLSGEWQFALDSSDSGVSEEWFAPGFDHSAWRTVQVPHTWQVEPGNEDYMGTAWYAREVAPLPSWRGNDLQLEFNAVYRDAQVWVNGELAGEHAGSGWTPFAFNITELWDSLKKNRIVVRVDNRFSENALPYKNVFDWATDGGITRSVRLRIAPPIRIDRIQVTATPSDDFSSAELMAMIGIITPEHDARNLKLEAHVFGPGGERVFAQTANAEIGRGEVVPTQVRGRLTEPSLWHFDRPNLYRIHCRLSEDGETVHEKDATFGIRRIEVKQGRYFLNGEPMRLMGVEWMPGSDPRYGMAEDPRVAQDILADMKRLNCIITRFHWQQDASIFEFCDREGMLVQEEVPTWGKHTLGEPIRRIQAMQLREMIASHFNHPSIYCWGICNEIAGQSEEGHRFVRSGMEIARTLDPSRLLTYASNTLHGAPARDAGRLLDFLEWNDYYESWYGGTLDDLENSLRRIHVELPDQSVVISEYGLCECSPNLPMGDDFRIGVMRSHNERYRKANWVAGAIFFDYNDYRTHIGDKGQGAFRQRVHGVVDLFGRRKPSWEALRREASPIKTLTVADVIQNDGTAKVNVVTRALENDLPAYILRDYLLTWTAFNEFDQPIGTGKRILPDLAPGSDHSEFIQWPEFDTLSRMHVEVFRPTGYSVLDTEWKSTGTR